MTSSGKLEAQEDAGYLSEVTPVLRSGGIRYQLSVKVVNVKKGRRKEYGFIDLFHSVMVGV